MKKIVFFCLIFIAGLTYSQEGFQLGVEMSPAWDLNTHRQRSTGIRSSESGYGFNIGVPIKYWFSEYMAIQSGLTFEYMAFDNRFNNQLVSSRRFGSIHLPVMLNYKLSGNWYMHFGGGVNYNVFNQSWAGFGVDISSQVNAFQPYGGVGISTLMERDNGVFEFGINGRYHFIDMWRADAILFDVEEFTSKVVSLDLILRFYLINT